MKNNPSFKPSARHAAVDVLLQVMRHGVALEPAFAASAEVAKLSPQDRAFCFHLCMSVCRYRGRTEALLTHFLTTPLKESRLDISIILWMGVVQHFVHQTPAHALVNESVELAKRYAQPLSGLVNAVLKKIIAQGAEPWNAADSWKHHLPQWLYERLRLQYGEAALREMVAVFSEEAPLDITLKTIRSHCEEAEGRRGNPESIEVKAGLLRYARNDEQVSGVELLPTGSLRLPADHAPVKDLPGYAEGQWWVQDAAAAIPVRLLGDLSGKTALDIGAAPGGKTAQLIDAGAKVTALDQSAPRVERLRENLQRLQMQAEILIADALQWKPVQTFDVIVLDAPCSATGTLRRHPDLPWLKQSADVSRLVEIQRKMLTRAASWVKPGGTLIYAVCSLLAEEGEAQIVQFLANQPFSLDPVQPAEIGHQSDWLLPDGAVRTLPHRFANPGGVDGFYIARLRRHP